MTHDTALAILDAIDANNDEVLESLRRQMLVAAINYARIRTDWSMATLEGRVEMDQRRRMAHNVLIDACNALSRVMLKQSRSVTWLHMLGQDRKEIGDFACHVHCIVGIRSR